MAFDDVFYLSLAGMVFAFAGLSLRFCFRSKCKKCETCCFKIDRDIENEIKEDDMIMHSRINIDEKKDGDIL